MGNKKITNCPFTEDQCMRNECELFILEKLTCSFKVIAVAFIKETKNRDLKVILQTQEEKFGALKS